MANLTSINWANVENLEKEINERFINNPDFDAKNLMVFAEVSPYSLVPVESFIDESNYFHIMDDPYIIGSKLYMGSKRQFIYEQYTIHEDSVKLELSEKFKTGWNEKKYVVFKNGYLINNNNLAFVIPGFGNDYLKKYIYSTVEFLKGDIVHVFYIDGGDDFTQVPVSRDIYIGALKYQATRSNERVIMIPYPNENYTKDSSSFFIFNESGEYLDNRVDYIVSEDGKYITLSEENALRRARVDYIVFAFPQLPTDPGIMNGFDSDAITDLNSGNALFRYAFSVDGEEGDQSGIVRFSPMFNEYRLTKKNFLLFGGGTFISPERYEVYSNDAIIFNSDYDKIGSATTRYTMIIFDDSTSHDEYQIPGEFLMTTHKVERPYQSTFQVPNMDARYRSYIVFRGTLLLDQDDYEYDEELKQLTITNPERYLEVGRSFYVIWLNALINNTNKERSFQQFSFLCNPEAQRGTNLPKELLRQDLNEDYLLIFLNGRHLRHSEYTIEDGKIFLDERFFLDDDDNLISLEGHKFFAIYLESLYTGKIAPIREEEAKQYREDWKKMDEDAVGGAVFKHYESRDWAEKRESGIVKFYPYFSAYRLEKKHILLFGNGTYIHPERYDLYDNGTIIFNNDYDKQHAQWAKYDMIVLDDKESDERYNPSSLIVKRVSATKDNQSVFEIPEVGARYRSFLVFKGSILLNKNFRYRIEDDEKHITILNDYDYVENGKSLTFVFLDAFARRNQEAQFFQFFFRCNSNGTTKLPANILNTNFNPEAMIIFLNGRYLDSSQYMIRDGYIYLDGYLLHGDFDHYVFTVVYLVTMITALKSYDYTLPIKPAFPVRPNDDLGNAFFEFGCSEDRESKGKVIGNSGIVKFEPEFTSYSLVKSNFLLFGNGTWIHPDRFEVYDNDTLIFTNEFDKSKAHKTHYTMAIFNDLAKRNVTYSPTYFKVVNVTMEWDNLNIIPIPDMNQDYKSFIVFKGSLLMGINDPDRYELDFEAGVLKIKHEEDYIKQGRSLSFVFLNAATTPEQRTIFLQETFKLEKNGPTLVPSSVYNEESFTDKHLLLFLNGMFIDHEAYEIRDNKLYIDDPYRHPEEEQWVTAVHIISILAEDYEEEVTIEERDPEGDADGFKLDYSFSVIDKNESNGLVSFLPIFTDFNLDKRNFLLFSRGLWVNPNRYDLYTNSLIKFVDREDRFAAARPMTMAILNEANKEEGYRPIAYTLRTVVATKDNQRLFEIPKEFKSTFIVFLGSLLLPISNEDRVFIDEEKGTLFLMDERDAVAKGRGLYFIFLNEDSSLNDRRYPVFLEETFDAVPDPRIGTPLPSDWYTDEEFDERFMMLFVGGRYVPPSYYEIRDHKIYPEINLDDIQTKDVIKKYQYTAVYLASYAQEGISHVTHPWEKEVIEENEFKCKDDLPTSDITDISGLQFETYTSTKFPVEDRQGRGWVQFLDRFDGYTLDKENFLLFGNSTWIDPDRYDLIDNGSIVFKDIHDQEHAEWANYSMVVFSNRDAIEEYGDHYIKTEYKIIKIACNQRWQHEFELPTLDDDWASFIVFKNSLILPIADESRYRWDDYNHKFEILEMEEYLEEGETLTFVYLKASSNLDQEVSWTQVSFKCEGYETVLPETVLLYQNQRYDKRRTLLFLNGTYVNEDRYAIKDNKVYLAEGNYLSDDEHLFTLVYLTTANSEEEEMGEREVVRETYEFWLDNIVFEERYAKPYIYGKAPTAEGNKGPNHLIFVKAFSSSASVKGIQGLVKLDPVFKGYLLEKSNFFLFSNGYFINPDRYELYDQDKVIMKSDEDKASSTYDDFTMLILGDSESYTNGFVAPRLTVHAVIAKGSQTTTFDIPVTEHEENRSFIAFRGTELLTGYKIDWESKKLTLNDLTPSFKDGEILNFVFLESYKTQEDKYPVFYQESFPASMSGYTRLPDRLKGVESSKLILFLNGRLLRLSDFLIEEGQILITVDEEDQQFTAVVLSEKDDIETGIIRR